ncbi:nodulation protein NfeD [Bacillus sp. T3]|uniref:NfeD family protein n=1 Tax=Bacillus sp. T3 TaxID=467262 RepID=UPI002980E3AB|nr:nodulation protein NfeD [Bacillus sp. T3]
MRKWIYAIMLLFAFSILSLPESASSNQKIVYIVPIEATVEKGLSAFLKRAVSTAEKDHAEAIIFVVNTPGGAVDAASEIGRILTTTSVKTISFINKQALSAGAYISLNTDEIYMVPGATIGSAAIIDSEGNTAGKKAESYWIAAMKSAANQAGRNPIYAQAMADEYVDLPEYGAGKGKLLTLTSEQAVEVGYSEGTVKDLDALLTKLGFENAEIRNLDESFAEKIARFLTNPVVVPILLTIGSLGLVLELFSPGFGVAGFMGLSSLLLFFYGHLVAGLAGFETLVLFVVGIALVILEIFLPGGIVGAIGGISILGSLFLATDDVVHMGISILIAIGVSIIGSIIMIRVFGKKMSLFKKIILTDSTNTESGYVSNRNRTELLGLEGITLTPLRPAGTMLIENERLDVVSEGEFIPKDRSVIVIKVEGVRIVVRSK